MENKWEYDYSSLYTSGGGTPPQEPPVQPAFTPAPDQPPVQDMKPARKKRGIARRILTGALALVVAAGVGFGGGWAGYMTASQVAGADSSSSGVVLGGSHSTVEPAGDSGASALSKVDVSSLVEPSVVVITTEQVVMSGGFFGQYVGMRRTDKLIHDEIEGLSTSGLETFRQRLPEKNPSPVVVYARRLLDAGADRPLKDKLLSEFEIHADKDMAWSRYLAKLGPMLGLMGTLIPMGPALVGLSTGDIGSMAYNMQVAFATTVVGMVSAAIGYFTEQVKQRWYLKDLTALQYLSDVLDGGAASGRAQAEGGEAR